MDWIKVGIENGWCGPPVCSAHDGTPMAESEYDEFDDVCIHIIRLYQNDDHKREVEASHSPSIWRKAGYS
jgi:hypothetical protein